jgi:hypothetical protein
MQYGARMIFLFRFGLGAVSYAARTPGGLFAPLLVLGAQIGLLCGILGNQWFSAATPSSAVFAVVGMAAFFSAVVRAPLTGIILVTEMTASFTLLLPMLAACCAAMAVPTLRLASGNGGVENNQVEWWGHLESSVTSIALLQSSIVLFSNKIHLAAPQEKGRRTNRGHRPRIGFLTRLGITGMMLSLS